MIIENIDNVKRLYIDTNIFIYLLEGDEQTQDKAKTVFKIASENNLELITSYLTITECLIGPIRDKNHMLIQHYNNLFSEEDFVTLVPVSERIIINTAHIAATQRLKTVDAIHFTTAQMLECQIFISNDKGFKSTDNLRVLAID